MRDIKQVIKEDYIFTFGDNDFGESAILVYKRKEFGQISAKPQTIFEFVEEIYNNGIRDAKHKCFHCKGKVFSTESPICTDRPDCDHCHKKAYSEMVRDPIKNKNYV